MRIVRIIMFMYFIRIMKTSAAFEAGAADDEDFKRMMIGLNLCRVFSLKSTATRWSAYCYRVIRQPHSYHSEMKNCQFIIAVKERF